MTETSSIVALKNLGYIPAILLGLSLESYTILAVLMLLDTIFGVIRTGVVHGGRSIKSYKLAAGIISKLSIILIPVLLAWAGRGAGINLITLAQGTLGVLILAETYSILSNIYSIRVRKDIHEYDAVSAILLWVRSLIESIIKTTVDKSKK